MVAAEEAKALADIEADLLGDGDPDAVTELPEQGVAAAEIKEKLAALMAKEKGEHFLRKWGGIYKESDGELAKLQGDIWSMYNATNALYPGVFPSVRKFEAELLSMVTSMVHGGPGACGLLASGGTESIFLCVLAHKKHWAATRGITEPEIVCADTAHPALYKAGQYFGIKVIKTPVRADLRADVSAMRAAINRNTIMLYASAMTFPHGVIDDVAELAALAQEKDIGCHVDNCLGGFLLSFLSEAGKLHEGRAVFDFRVPGVTSMSVDVHKYGVASKGVSVAAFASEELRRASYVPVADWCGGYYVTPTLQGSRSGAVIAAAWATLVNRGKSGYMQHSLQIHETHQRALAAVAATPGIKPATDADAAVVPIMSDHPSLDIYALASELTRRGWSVFCMQDPACVTWAVGEQTWRVADDFIAELQAIAAEMMAEPGKYKADGKAGVYTASAHLPAEQIERVLRRYIDISLTVKPAA